MEKIALFLATKKGFSCLEEAITNGYSNDIECVISFKEVNVSKSYDGDIRILCDKYRIKYFDWKEIKENLIDELNALNIDIAFAIGWRYLMPITINNILKYDLIIFHDSLLPKYRGFAPTPTAIMCGDTVIGVTALFATDEVDKGDIILQKSLEIEDEEYISEIISRQSQLYAEMMLEILNMVKEKGVLFAKKQEEVKVSYSIWRNTEDCQINWNCTSREIYNKIRAVSSPYPGAYCYLDNIKIIIRKAKIVEDMIFAIRQPGKIWSIIDNKPIVICGKGLIKILEAEYEDGKLVEFNKIRIKL